MLNTIEKTDNGYLVEIIEYLADYSEENSIIIRNTSEEEIGRANIEDNETKMQEIVKNNIERFTKKEIKIKKEKDLLVVTKVEKK